MNIESFKKLNKKNNLPDKPGVYFFLKTSPPAPLLSGEGGRRSGEVLYIGKATSLKDRVKSYFGKDLIETRGSLLVDMVFKADKIKYQITDSVLEALILEANLIKKYQPKYNTKEKSDKSFNYVCITKEKLPKVLVMRGKELIQEQQNFSRFTDIFGPYPNGSQLREAMKIVRRIFPFLDDKSKNYLEFYKQINLVPDLKDQKLYRQNIKNIILFFSGKKQQVFKNLKKEMNVYAKLREFEKANEIKRQIFALKHINDVALIKDSSTSQKYTFPQVFGSPGPQPRPDHSEKYIFAPFRMEAYDIAHMSGKNMVGVMTVVEGGEVAKSEYKKFKIRSQSGANDTGALKEVLERRFAHSEWPYPNFIVVDGGTAQINVAKNILNKLNLDIRVVSVLKDEHHKPKDILLSSPRPYLKGTQGLAFINKYRKEILLANSEAHRFAINYHKSMRNKNFLK